MRGDEPSWSEGVWTWVDAEVSCSPVEPSCFIMHERGPSEPPVVRAVKLWSERSRAVVNRTAKKRVETRTR